MTLTPRQLQILDFLSRGECYDSIAVKLDKPTTQQVVKNEASRLFRAMGVTGKTEAVALALRGGLIV